MVSQPDIGYCISTRESQSLLSQYQQLNNPTLRALFNRKHVVDNYWWVCHAQPTQTCVPCGGGATLVDVVWRQSRKLICAAAGWQCDVIEDSFGISSPLTPLPLFPIHACTHHQRSPLFTPTRIIDMLHLYHQIKRWQTNSAVSQSKYRNMQNPGSCQLPSCFHRL